MLRLLTGTASGSYRHIDLGNFTSAFRIPSDEVDQLGAFDQMAEHIRGQLDPTKRKIAIS